MFDDREKDFLRDDNFIRYVLGDVSDTQPPWEVYLGENTWNSENAEAAKAVLLASADVNISFSAWECQDLKDRISNTIKGLN